MFLRSLSVLVLTAVLSAGCDENTSEQAPEKRPRLVSPEEIRAIEQKLLAEVAEIKGKKCPRPVLRGKALSGSAEKEIVALVEGTPELKKCQELLETHDSLLRETLFYPQDQTPPGTPRRDALTAREITKPGKELSEITAACLPVADRIHKAVRYPMACSPYRPGLRGQPKLIWAIRALRYSAYRAHALLSGGKTRDGFELLLDGLRFCQDFSRGGTSVLEAMIAVGAGRSLLPVIEQGLNRKEPLEDGLLAQVESELGELIETQPHPATFLRGEIQTMALYTFMPGIKGKGWTPPGGWGDEGGPNDRAFSAREFGLDDVESNALAQIAMQETGREWLKGCKQDKLPIECYRHMEKLGRELQERTKDPGSISSLLKYAFAEDKVKETRRQIIEILKSIASPAFDKYVAKQGQAHFALAGLRLQAAYRRLAEKQKTCPDAAVFEKPPLSELRTDPYSGGRIKVESTAPGKLVLRPPVPMGKQGGDDAEPAVIINCPYAKPAP